MLPAPRTQLQARVLRLRPWHLLAMAAGLALLAEPAWAQDGQAAVSPQTTPEPAAANAPAAPVVEASDGPIGFEADEVEYNDKADTVTAKGAVVLRRDDQSVRADQVTWDRNTGKIVATGNIRLIDEDGNQLFTDRVELTDELKTGAMENLLIALREGGRLAAQSGKRLPNGDVVLTHASYTACEVEDTDGCPKRPTWRITAAQVVYQDDQKSVRFKGARLEIFGIRLMPLPGLLVATDGRAISGPLIPDLRLSASNGVEISEGYYLRLSDSSDLTATGYVYTKAPPMISGQYRALTSKGSYQITGYATKSDLIAVSGQPSNAAESNFRGYVYANGRFQLSPEWSVTSSIRRSTDRTFLRRYDISRDDRLRSMVDVERIAPNSYLSIAGWSTQTLRVNDDQGQVPLALPAIDYRHRFTDPLVGGRLELQVNSLAILRSNGQDTQRAFAGARWDLTRITGLGQQITLTGLVRGDVYHSDDNTLTSTVIYRGQPGWQTRGIATAAVDVKWPLVGAVFGGTQVLTPRVQLVATPSIRNLAVPNEDARAVDLEDSNLFALNRFPGYDRVEDGVRFTYGFDWQFEAPRWKIKTTIGQSYRLTNEQTLLPDGTGLSSRTSDIVGRTEVYYRGFLKVTHRFRLDKDSFAIRRNEFDATIGDSKTYAEVGYVRLNRNIQSIEDLQDREELRVAGRVAFKKYWSLFGSAVVNLTDRNEDPTNLSDGFQPIRTRLGVAYQDDCLELAFTWRRDYVATGDARKGNVFQVYFAVKNIGVR
ncbi:LPS-assembly protein LptD [Novosphingobium sp. JCM 18896]|uniref:LPS-assembly protein LptD n=1 Tax=Novosphingobium sp. JCM 18896 TaxID=2989731 RepID=UPI002221AEBF|nr:LPS assembly protein LptD [Novosphingobium sp. JCM 18896]MCW1431001.1 LPS assembly protein LptD [Novosphingobium sp. JCM 18896]